MQTRLAEFVKAKPEHDELDSILRACVHCGFCNATCPTYQVLGDELDGPRGRIYLLKQMLEGHTTTEHTQLHLDRCLTCRACETTCPSGVRYGRLLDLGRELVGQQVQRPFFEQLIRYTIVSVFAHAKRFAMMIAVARVLKPLLPQRWQDKIPVIEQQSPIPAMTRQSRQILLLEGCVQPTLAPDINTATKAVLQKLGISAITPEHQDCCGALSHHLSLKKQSLKQIKHNIDIWLPYLDQGVEAIVSTASGCGVMVKEYKDLLQYDFGYAEKAARISAATKDISEILLAEDLSRLAIDNNINVAFQSPCTLQHGQQLSGVVESILQQLGFNLISVNDAHLCCGSAGVYSLLQPALSERLLNDKLSALQAKQPDIIATANIGCLQQLQSASSTRVVHWIQLLG